MNRILDKVSRIGIVPVVKIDDLDDAAPLADALCKGGLPVAEVTFRTALAKDAMFAMKKARPDMILGAGTVLTTSQVDDAMEAGAEFIVSPGTNPRIVEYCQEKNIPVIPGCSTPSDIDVALEHGINTVKFFPAEALGGLKMIKALSGPYVDLKFMPTGGINESNICDYLANERIVACGGTWMIDAKLIKEKRFDKIEELTRSAVKKMLGLELDHVGVNASKDTDYDIAKEFAKLLGSGVKETEVSTFAGTTVEVMKKGRGTHGHIAYRVNNTDRAVRYFESQGYEFLEESAQYDEKGKLKLIYFKDEIAGFAVHLIQK